MNKHSDIVNESANCAMMVCTMGGLGGLFKIEQAAANLERPDATRRVASCLTNLNHGMIIMNN